MWVSERPYFVVCNSSAAIRDLSYFTWTYVVTESDRRNFEKEVQHCLSSLRGLRKTHTCTMNKSLNFVQLPFNHCFKLYSFNQPLLYHTIFVQVLVFKKMNRVFQCMYKLTKTFAESFKFSLTVF